MFSRPFLPGRLIWGLDLLISTNIPCASDGPRGLPAAGGLDPATGLKGENPREQGRKPHCKAFEKLDPKGGPVHRGHVGTPEDLVLLWEVTIPGTGPAQESVSYERLWGLRSPAEVQSSWSQNQPAPANFRVVRVVTTRWRCGTIGTLTPRCSHLAPESLG